MSEQSKVMPRENAFPENQYGWVWGMEAWYPFETFLQTIVSPYANIQIRFAGKPTQEAVETAIQNLKIAFETLPTEAQLEARKYAADKSQQVARIKKFVAALRMSSPKW